MKIVMEMLKILQIKQFIDIDLGKIREKIIQGGFKKIRYSYDQYGYIGQKKFNIGQVVKKLN